MRSLAAFTARFLPGVAIQPGRLVPPTPTGQPESPAGAHMEAAFVTGLRARATELIKVPLRNIADAVVTRLALAPMAVEGDGKDGDTIDTPVGPISRPAGATRVAAGDPSRQQKEILLTALVDALVKKRVGTDNKNLLVISRTSNSFSFRPESVADGADILNDLLGMIGTPTNNMPRQIPAAMLARLGASIPENVYELGRAIVGLMHDLEMDLLISIGDGRIAPVNIQNLSEGEEPLDVFLRKIGIEPQAQGMESHASEAPAVALEKPKGVSKSISEVLAGYDSLIMQAETKNRILRAVGVREVALRRNDNLLLDKILAKELTIPHGVVMIGPGGNGKTTLLDGTATAYLRSGCPVVRVSVGVIEQKYIASLANNLAQQCEAAKAEARRTGKPALVIVDEAENLITRVDMGSSNAQYYVGGLNVLKKYANDPELVFMLAANVDRTYVDPNLVRSLRLELAEVTLPNDALRQVIFERFLKEDGIISGLTQEQYRQFVLALPESTPADIRKFTSEYFKREINAAYARLGYTDELDIARYLDGGGAEITRDSIILQGVTFENLLTDLKAFAQVLRSTKAGKNGVGFV